MSAAAVFQIRSEVAMLAEERGYPLKRSSVEVKQNGHLYRVRLGWQDGSRPIIFDISHEQLPDRLGIMDTFLPHSWGDPVL